MSLSTSRAPYSGCTKLSWCMTRFMLGQITVSGLSLTSIKVEKSFVRGKLQHHFWALMGLYSVFRRRQQRLKTGVELPCSKRDLGLSETCYMRTTCGYSGTGKGQLTPWDQTEALGCVKFMMTVGYQHLRSFGTILKSMLPLPSTKEIVLHR